MKHTNLKMCIKYLLCVGDIDLSRFGSPDNRSNVTINIIITSLNGMSLMHLSYFTPIQGGRVWFKGNSYECAAFTAFRAIRDLCTCVYHVVALVELSILLFFT